MKLYKILMLFSAIALISSCGNDFVVEDYYDLEELPPYVAFDADGNSAFIDPFSVGEEDGSIGITVENPTGTESDITVEYSLGGSAVFGEDYTIEGASANGGTVTISAERGSFNETFRNDIDITIIDNDDYDSDPRDIIITLTSASHADGDLVVGRGGRDFLREAIVNINDDECVSEYAGSYAVETTTDSIVIDGVLTDSTSVFTGSASIVKVDDAYFTYDVDDASGGFYASDFIGGGTLPVTFDEDCGGITATEITNSNGQSVSLLSGSVNGDGVITLVFKEADTGNQFTSVFTPN